MKKLIWWIRFANYFSKLSQSPWLDSWMLGVDVSKCLLPGWQTSNPKQMAEDEYCCQLAGTTFSEKDKP